MRLAAKFPTSGKWRPCSSDLPGMFYRTQSRPELTIATHRNSIKAWGGRGILDITHINDVPVKFTHRGTYETFNRYEAAYASSDLLRLVTMPMNLVELPKEEAPPAANTRTVQQIKDDALKAVAVKNAKAEAARKAEAEKPKKRKRISYAERLRRREIWLNAEVIKIAKELAAIKRPEGIEIIDLDISWFDNRFGTYDGLLFDGENTAHVLLSYQTLWSRPKTNWRDLSIQRHPDPLPTGENYAIRGYLPDFLARLKGKHVAVKGIYIGTFDTRLVPGWPMAGNTKYGMKKVVATVMPANVSDLRNMISREVKYIAPERLERLRAFARAYDYDGYRRELKVQA